MEIKKVAFLFILCLQPLFADTDPLYTQVKKELLGQNDYSKRSVKPIGNRTIEMEFFVNTEGDFKLCKGILNDTPNYHRWILNEINKNREGSRFVFNIEGIDHLKENEMKLRFSISAGPLAHKGERPFNITSVSKEKSFALKLLALPNETGMMEKGEATITIFPAENQEGRIWVHFYGRAQIRSETIYQLLPARLIDYEIKDRILQIAENYFREEDRQIEEKSRKIASPRK